MKTSYFFLAIIVVLTWFAAVFAGSGAETLPSFTRFLAVGAMFLLSLSLAIGPAALIVPKEFAPLIEARRAVGVAAFVFVVGHVSVIAGPYFGYDFSKMLSTTPLIAGMAGYIIMIALTLTSTDFAIRKMGNPNWKLLQRATYIAFAVSFYHTVVQIQQFGLDANKQMNAAQIFVLLFSIFAVALQIYGFVIRKGREGASKSAPAAQEKPSAPSP